MSLEDLFGSDLEDSEDEERGKPNAEASRKAQLDELFGDSPSEEEAEEREQSEERSARDIDSASGQESDRSDEHEKQEENDEEDIKEEIHEPSHHQHSLTADLFGDDEDLSSEEEQEKVSPKADYEERNQQDEPQEAEDFAERREILAEGEEGEREGEGEEEEEETVIDVTIPYCKVSLGSEVFFVKMPNFLSVETKPFDAALYEDEVEDDEVLDEEGNARLKLKVENTIRWRSCKDQDGNDVKESNARVVRWSDGTRSLLLGGEVFDIHKTKIDGDFNHLFVQQGTGLQAQTVFKEKLTFRPHSTASQTHRKMTLSIADRASKAQKIRILPAAGKDPEAQRHEMIKKEEERLRTQLRRESQQRRIRERGHNKGLSASYLEPDRYGEEEDDFQSLLALKKKYKKDLAQGVGFHRGDLSDDSLGGGVDGLESDEEEEDTDKLLAAKEDKESDNEPDNTRRKRTSSEGGSTKKRKKVIVESDDEESD